MTKMLKSLLAATVLMFSLGASASEEATGPSLFDRLGGEAGARQIVADTYHNHTVNPIVKKPFFIQRC